MYITKIKVSTMCQRNFICWVWDKVCMLTEKVRGTKRHAMGRDECRTQRDDSDDRYERIFVLLEQYRWSPVITRAIVERDLEVIRPMVERLDLVYHAVRIGDYKKVRTLLKRCEKANDNWGLLLDIAVSINDNKLVRILLK